MSRRRPGRVAMAAALGQVAWGAHAQWRSMPAHRRERLQTLLRKSGGRPGNLSAAEREEVRGLVADLNLGQIMRDGALRVSGRGSWRRR